jgi:hypothetical protein
MEKRNKTRSIEIRKREMAEEFSKLKKKYDDFISF